MTNEYLTHYLGVMHTMYGHMIACISCAQASPSDDVYLDGARFGARGLAHFGRIAIEESGHPEPIWPFGQAN